MTKAEIAAEIIGGANQASIDALNQLLSDLLAEVRRFVEEPDIPGIPQWVEVITGFELMAEIFGWVILIPSILDSLDDFFEEISFIWLRASLEFIVRGVIELIPDHRLDQYVLTGRGALTWAAIGLGDSFSRIITTSPFEIVVANAVAAFIEWAQRVRLGFLGTLADVVAKAPTAIFISLFVRALSLGGGIVLLWVISDFTTDTYRKQKDHDLPHKNDEDYRGRWPEMDPGRGG